MNNDQFRKELEGLLNRYCMENESNTPDFILAEYLIACLDAWNRGIDSRKRWHVPQADSSVDPK